jgi:hypothetical protein
MSYPIQGEINFFFSHFPALLLKTETPTLQGWEKVSEATTSSHQKLFKFPFFLYSLGVEKWI